MRTHFTRILLAAGTVGLATAACGSRNEPAPEAATATPVYNADTGRLEALVSDRDGDGKVDTRAFMNGTRVMRIEMDRDGDGRVDRWETYGPPAVDAPANIIELAEEAGAEEGRIVRREVYTAGVLTRVEEDTDHDGRMDKWETYQAARLVQVEMDLSGAGHPTRRLTYGADGTVQRVEADPDGDGIFAPLPPAGGEPR
jgi:hypothetical protein